MNEASTPPGSSPLTRGKPFDSPLGACCVRLIPAHAGKTGCRSTLNPLLPAHPRSRGENLRASASAGGHPGSSPLTRGKPVEAAHDALCPRLIPAHAGKTPRAVTLVFYHSAHPRSRGENGLTTTHRAHRDGSSPLTRGKPCGAKGRVSRGRLIPAHAGKTWFPWGARPRVGAHPRSRGENHCE